MSASGSASSSIPCAAATAFPSGREKAKAAALPPHSKGSPLAPGVGQVCPTYPARRTNTAKRLQVGRKDHRFWPVAAALLDILDAFEGRIADAAAWMGITTSNLVSTFQDDRHLLAAAQAMRKKHGHPPLK